MPERLADVARRVVAKKKHDGHLSALAQRRAQCQADINRVEASLKTIVLAAAQDAKSRVKLLTLNGWCVHSEKDDDPNKHIKCPQCLAFKQRLEQEGFFVHLVETKYNFQLDISWEDI